MAEAIVRNCETGQRAIFTLPCGIGQFEKIGVTEDYSGQVCFENGPDTFGFGLDGYLYYEELCDFLNDYANTSHPRYLDYAKLAQMKADCDYFLGYGKLDESRLSDNSVGVHIAEMKALWQKLPEDGKPEWLTWNELLKYERRMSPEGIKQLKRFYEDKNLIDEFLMRGKVFAQSIGKTVSDFMELLEEMEKIYHALSDEEKPVEFMVSQFNQYRQIIREKGNET